VLGILPGTIGAIQATEAIKLILGQGESLIGRLLLYDALNMSFDEVRLRKNPNCPICSEHPTLTELIDYEQFCGMPAHDHSEFSAADLNSNGHVAQMTPQQLKARLDKGDDLFILDVREPHEWDISNLAHLGAVLIPKGEVLNRMNELDTAREMVVQCRSGARSAAVIQELQTHGFKKLWNLEGGINRWAREVDPSLPIY
ncbi:MAG: molybdenum cofactor biosynthesis protein MoeB, partial [Anaerolineales bacterium]|nr:molybdenum cofactor biosynthesis protein MoeB [Anaerolineales bacterium]